MLVLALGFRRKLSPQIWMCTGTASKREYIPMHEINLPDEIVKNIIAFYAITGCDSISQFAGKMKKTAWKVFMQEPEMLNMQG